MQDLGVFGLESGFFFSTILKVLWQSFSSSIRVAMIIINPKVILWQFLSLLKTQAFYVFETLEFVVVYKYKNLMFTAL